MLQCAQTARQARFPLRRGRAAPRLASPALRASIPLRRELLLVRTALREHTRPSPAASRARCVPQARFLPLQGKAALPRVSSVLHSARLHLAVAQSQAAHVTRGTVAQLAAALSVLLTGSNPRLAALIAFSARKASFLCLLLQPALIVLQLKISQLELWQQGLVKSALVLG